MVILKRSEKLHLACRGNICIYAAALCLHSSCLVAKAKRNPQDSHWLRDAETSIRNSAPMPDSGTVHSKMTSQLLVFMQDTTVVSRAL